MFYVYILKSKVDGDLYIWYTSDLKRRFAEHNSGENRSTKGRKPFELIYYESYRSKEDAMRREKALKLRGQALNGLKQRIVNSLLDLRV